MQAFVDDNKRIKVQKYSLCCKWKQWSIYCKTKCNHLIKPEAVEDCYITEGCTPEWVPLPWGNVILSCISINIDISVVYQIL